MSSLTIRAEDVSSSLKSSDMREIGNEAVWTLSTAKPGNGVDQLRDNNLETYWQSDGAQPHTITVQFHKKTRISEISLYVDAKLDESYTPSKMSVRAGTGDHDLQDLLVVNLEEPTGWITIPLSAAERDSESKFLRANLLQIAILASHQNGRDTHLRQVKLFGPRQAAAKGLGTDLSSFSSIEFQQFSGVR